MKHWVIQYIDIKMFSHCVGLDENGSHSHINLITWLQVGEPLWER